MNKVGRGTKYDPRYIDQVYKLCLLGATDMQLADFFNVDESTINRWKKRHPEFTAAVRQGKMIPDAAMAESLYKAGIGYSHPDVHIALNRKGEAVITNIIKHYPPNVTAAIFWLKNRQSGHWRDKQEITHIPAGFTGSLQPILIENPHNQPQLNQGDL